MKMLALFLTAMVVFATAPVFACGGPCDKDQDKDDQAFTADVEYLCGGGCTKPKPAPAPEPEPTCKKSCGGDKDKKPAPKPECGKDCTCEKCSKDEEQTKP
ncbi:MAG: hypothetical protein DRP56_10450 [Planctomycetota bacterium]|nr:MAG: hypothetical protein DRP56_10450 [Planctomycetota bacterium]